MSGFLGFFFFFNIFENGAWAFQVAQWYRICLPVWEIQETWVQTLSQEDARDMGSNPESGRSPESGNGNSLQYSFLGNPRGRGAWQATVCRVAKSQTWLSTHISKGNTKYTLEPKVRNLKRWKRRMGLKTAGPCPSWVEDVDRTWDISSAFYLPFFFFFYCSIWDLISLTRVWIRTSNSGSGAS